MLLYDLCVRYGFIYFFFNDTATTEIYTLSLHDALPILLIRQEVQHGRSIEGGQGQRGAQQAAHLPQAEPDARGWRERPAHLRSEEHTSELQSRQYLVCRLLLEKKKKNTYTAYIDQ